MTTKLFWQDSHLFEFEASVLNLTADDSGLLVELDRTAFYPTGGGQPCDLGRLAGFEVLDVSVADDERIWHRLAAGALIETGMTVAGEVDRDRRLELMQQHTGQHVLSQAFFQLYGAETRGFRITDRGTEIDLAFDNPPDDIDQVIRRAEDLANRIVFDDRLVRSHEVSPEEASRLPLRKESFIADCVRVIEIEDFDWSPCGGTHVVRTGEIGLIAVRGWERAKRMIRVHFCCGLRALAEFRSAVGAADNASLMLSVGRDELIPSIARLQDENKQLSRRVRELALIEAKMISESLLAAAVERSGIRVITTGFDVRPFEEVKMIAHRLVEAGQVVALLGTREGESARLVFARSENVSVDLNKIMKAACDRIGGRGGGKPDFVMGGGPAPPDLNDFLAELAGLID